MSGFFRDSLAPSYLWFFALDKPRVVNPPISAQTFNLNERLRVGETILIAVDHRQGGGTVFETKTSAYRGVRLYREAATLIYTVVILKVRRERGKSKRG